MGDLDDTNGYGHIVCLKCYVPHSCENFSVCGGVFVGLWGEHLKSLPESGVNVLSSVHA